MRRWSNSGIRLQIFSGFTYFHSVFYQQKSALVLGRLQWVHLIKNVCYWRLRIPFPQMVKIHKADFTRASLILLTIFNLSLKFHRTPSGLENVFYGTKNLGTLFWNCRSPRCRILNHFSLTDDTSWQLSHFDLWWPHVSHLKWHVFWDFLFLRFIDESISVFISLINIYIRWAIIWSLMNVIKENSEKAKKWPNCTNIVSFLDQN